MKTIKYLNSKFRKEGRYVQKIFDPIQTHALYGIPVEDLSEFKKQLRELGAKRFRQVKASHGFVTLCFKFD